MLSCLWGNDPYHPWYGDLHFLLINIYMYIFEYNIDIYVCMYAFIYENIHIDLQTWYNLSIGNDLCPLGYGDSHFLLINIYLYIFTYKYRHICMYAFIYENMHIDLQTWYNLSIGNGPYHPGYGDSHFLLINVYIYTYIW
jgi:hypothetical protein